MKIGARSAHQRNWEWPDSLDAVIAAPEHHEVLLENDQVRVLDVRIAPHERVPVHTHRWPSVLYVLSWGDFVRYDAVGNVLLGTRRVASPSGSLGVVWSEPLPPHSLENVGESEIHVISLELK